MAYPESSDVTAGQPTAYQHYNNLRADALRLGALVTDGVNMGSLLASYHDNINLYYLATNRVRCMASAAAPACIVIGGVPLYADADVDLPAGSVPTGAAAIWYIFAVRSVGSTSFTLDVNTTATETTTRRLIGWFYWTGTAIAYGSVQSYWGAKYEEQGPRWFPHLCNGRLTLTTATPVTTADVTGAGTVYFTPFRGYQIGLYTPGGGWFVYQFTEVSISLSGKTAGTVHDIFIYDAGGSALTLELVQWSSATTRATALVTQDGVLVKSGSVNKRYLGTVYIIATGVTEDSVLNRCVWNYYNRLPRHIYDHDATANWTGPGSWRYWNNSSAHCFKTVIGVQEDVMQLNFVCKAGSAGVPAIGIGIDTTTAPSWGAGNVSSDSQTEFLYANYVGNPGIGYHYLALLEYCDSGLLYGAYSRRYSGAAGHILA